MTPKMKDTIPEGWHTYTLGEIYTERKEAGDPELPILTVSIHSGVSDGALDEDEIGKTVKRIADKTQYKTARAGDLVFNMMRAWQGAIGVARSDGLVSPAYIVATPNEELVYPLFMDYYMKSPKMVGIINRQSYGVTDFRKRLYWDSFAPIKCTLPSIADQRKIVEILVLQDRVINLLEELYQEKLLHKKHLHKVLLSSENSSTDDRYTTVKMSDLCCFISESGTGFKCDYISAENMEPDLSGHVSFPSSTESVEGIRYSTNDVLISNIRPYLQKVWLADKCGICSTDVLVVRAKAISPVQLYYLVANEMFFNEIMKTAKGSKMPRGDKEQILQMNVKVPQGKEQQEKTTLVLQSTDRSLHLLKNRIELEKQKEKALMQLLLTGIVRV